MSEKELAQKLIDENEKSLCEHYDHVASGVKTRDFPELETCDFKKLQKEMAKNWYKIEKETDRPIEEQTPYSNETYVVYRATMKF